MIKKLAFTSSLFDLKIRINKRLTSIDMQLNTTYVNTCELPHTYDFISSYIPSVLSTKCFNENNLPFNVEINATEIGHLFEHILLDKLCKLKIAQGCKKACYSGNTSWNWKSNPYGSFQILVDVGSPDFELLINALKETISLTKSLMSFNNSLLLINEKVRNEQNLRATVSLPAEN